MTSGFRLKLISSVGIHTEEHLIERNFAFSDPSLVGTTRYNLFYKDTTFENSFGKYSPWDIENIVNFSVQRIEEHLTSFGKNGAYNEYAAASMKMTRNNVDKITMFWAWLDQGRPGTLSMLFNHLVHASPWVWLRGDFKKKTDDSIWKKKRCSATILTLAFYCLLTLRAEKRNAHARNVLLRRQDRQR